MEFKELELREEIQKSLEDMNFVTMTKIQELAINSAVKGNDILGQAQTGTGKTASFVIPILEKLDMEKTEVQAMILVPTRELAVQIQEEIEKMGKYLDVNVLSIYGGQPMDRQIAKLRTKPQIVVGTPGRTIDMINRKKLKLHAVDYFVLDEVDEMLNMGFIDDVEEITQKMPKSKQTLLYSATLPSKIKNLTQNYLVDPQIIKVDSKSLTVDKVEQKFIVSKQSLKPDVLRDLLLLRKDQRVIVFVQTKKYCDELYDYLNQNNFNVNKIHGDIVQASRIKTINDLKRSKFNILVATDVVARGIDIDGIDLVVNMQLPQEREYYIHRIGRTARGDSQKGEAITLVTTNEYKKEFKHYEKYLKCEIKEIDRPKKQDIVNKLMWNYFQDIEGKISGDIDENYQNLAQTLLSNHHASVLVPQLLKMIYPELDRSYNDEIEFKRKKNDRHKKEGSEPRKNNRRDNRRRDGGRPNRDGKRPKRDSDRPKRDGEKQNRDGGRPKKYDGKPKRDGGKSKREGSSKRYK